MILFFISYYSHNAEIAQEPTTSRAVALSISQNIKKNLVDNEKLKKEREVYCR
jgi:hypothetical protein